MPFKSKSQRRFMYAAEARGDVPKGTAKKWEEHTPKDKPLPEKVASVRSHVATGAIGAILGTGAGIRAGQAMEKWKEDDRKKLEAAYNAGIAAGQQKTAFERGFEKKANFAHAAELAGLGILAAPATHELANKEQAEKVWTPKKKAIADVVGLGVLAAPSVAHFAGKLMGK